MFNTYSTGTASVASGATSIVGSGSNWSGTNAKPGDDIVIAGHTVIVLDVVNATTLTIDAWPYTTVAAGTAYKIVQRSPLRFVGGQAMADVSTLVGALNTDGFYVFVPSTATVPDPSYGNDGQYAFQASSGKLWIKSGSWNYLGIYKGFNFTGAYNGATAYGVNDVATYNGGAYIVIAATTGNLPTNTTYWSQLAAAGSTGATGPAPLKPVVAWVTATAYVTGPPADYVTINGSSYQCLIAHTSGTFATDLAAGKWGLVAQAGTNGTNGTNGAGYGGTSATSLLIASGTTKVFTTQAGLAYTNGARVRASSNANTANYMEGTATYSGTTLSIVVDRIGGSGTFADWNLNVVGLPGAGGGDLLSTNNLSDVANADTALTNLKGVSYNGTQTLTDAQKTKFYSNTALVTVSRGYIAGLTLSTAGASSSFSVAAGVAADDTNVNFMLLSGTYTKTTSAWFVGSANGSLDSGSIAANTWYHVWLIKRPDTGVVDVLISLSATAPTMPTNYTLKRRIGSMKTNGSLQWLKFIQDGDTFMWDSPVADVSATAPGTAAVLRTLSLPLGVRVKAFLSVVGQATAVGSDGLIAIYVSDPSLSDIAAHVANGTVSQEVYFVSAGGGSTALGGQVWCYTNTSSQVRTRVQQSTAGSTLSMSTLGWADSRGKDA